MNSRRLMWRLLIIVAVFGVVPPSRTITADAEIPLVAPTRIVNERLNGLSNPGYGIWWDLALPTPPTSYVEFHETNAGGEKSSDSILCAGYSDPNCAARPLTGMTSVAALGRCLSEDEIACIEGIRLRTGTNDLVDLQFVSYAGQETDFDQSASLSLPRGSSISRWRDANGSDYAVIASVMTTLRSATNAWTQLAQNATFNVVRLASGSDLNVSPPSIVAPSAMPYKTVGNSNPPPRAIEFAPSTRIELTMRLSNSITGWFNGRFAEGSVASRSLPNNRTSYTFTADAASTYVAGGVAAPSSALDDIVKRMTGRSWTAPASWGHTPGNPGSVDHYKSWLPYLGDKALVTQTRWTISGTNWSAGNCFSGGSGISALLGTNAAVFDGSPPTWNSSTKSLSFKVASPHYDENGGVASGVYTLALPSSSVKCLYGQKSLPAYFEISVVSDKDGTQVVSTSSLSERDGWVNFSAKGFHFSEPTITVRFMDDPTAPAASTGSSSQTPTGNFFTSSVKKSKATLSITMTKRQTVKIYRKVGKTTVLLKTLTVRKGKTTFATAYKKSYSFIVKDAKGKTIRRWSPA